MPPSWDGRGATARNAPERATPGWPQPESASRRYGYVNERRGGFMIPGGIIGLILLIVLLIWLL